MKHDSDQEASRHAGNWIGVGTAIGAALFVLTDEPLWIALGVALGAALDWRKSQSVWRLSRWRAGSALAQRPPAITTHQNIKTGSQF